MLSNHEMKQRLTYLILGQRGGQSRVQIIQALRQRPSNINQLASMLDLNYRTVKHHVDMLLKHGLIGTSRTGGYGEVYFVSPDLEQRLPMFEEISNKLKTITTSPRFFQSVLEQINDAVTVIDEHQDIIFWNRAAEALYGFGSQEIICKPLPMFKDMGHFRDHLKALAAGKRVVGEEMQAQNKSGAPLVVEVTVDAIRDEGDRLVGHSIISTDVTERRKAEERIRHLATFPQLSPLPIIEMDLDGKVTYENAAMGRVLKDAGLTDASQILPKDMSKVLKTLQEKPGSTVYREVSAGERTFQLSVFQPRGIECYRLYAVDLTERKRAEDRQAVLAGVLGILNLPETRQDLIPKILSAIREYTGIEAAAIRLNEGGDYPYYTTKGFSESHLKAENSLCSFGADGKPVLDGRGDPVVDCMCGNVIRGRTDPALPFFTRGGSFWTNSTTDLNATATEEQLGGPLRNRCNTEGFESVALVPLRSGDEVIGLIQLNDRRRDRFTPDVIRFFEELGSSIGIALARRRQAEALQSSERRFRELFMTAPWGVVYQDATGYITHANPAAERMLGLSVAQMQGRTSMNPEWRSVKKDGSPFPGSEHPSMVSLRTGKPQKDVVMGVYNPRRKGYTWININAVPQFRQGEPKPYEVYTTFEEIPGPAAPPAPKPSKRSR
jgi:PAS domain S-box-containing protein